MGKMITFKGLKVIASNHQAIVPPNLGNFKFPRGKQIKMSLGAFGTDKYKKEFDRIKKINNSYREYFEEQGIEYKGVPIKKQEFDTKKGKINDLIFDFNLTTIYENEKKDEETGELVKDYNEVLSKSQYGIEPLFTIKGEETDMFPYGGDVVDVYGEIRVRESKGHHRADLVVHKIDIIERTERSSYTGTNKIQEIEIDDDIFADIDVDFGDNFEAEVVEEKPKKESIKKATPKPKKEAKEEYDEDDIFADVE